MAICNKDLPLHDEYDTSFFFAVPDGVLEKLHKIDRDASGQLRADSGVNELLNPQSRNSYLKSSLVDEAITSSQLEGASTTQAVAKEMLIQGRKPRDHSEQMIFNNYQAMEFVRENINKPISVDLIKELHRIVTDETLDDPAASGRFRLSDEDIHVMDATHTQILHTPPKAELLDARMQQLCRFTNGGDEVPFVHPLIKAVILHFMIGYDHPFVDGNGRTARALFYWCAISQGYWLLEYISISRYIRQAPAKYARAYLYTETDLNDLTYFLIHQLDIILKGIDELKRYLRYKQQALQKTEHLLFGSPKLMAKLNHRQVQLLQIMLKESGRKFTIAGHKNTHGISYQTARTDLMSLSELGLCEMGKMRREFVFIAPSDLQKKLSNGVDNEKN